jgi:hypothetical protein
VYIICAMGIDIVCLSDFPIRFHNRSEGIVFLLFLSEWNDNISIKNDGVFLGL